jgi:hypothetical protein
MSNTSVTGGMIAQAEHAVREFHKGNYRPSMELDINVFGKTKKEAIDNCRRCRVESRHQYGVAGSNDFNYPHCSCGWIGPKVKTFDEAEKIKCPNRLRQLKNYSLSE